MIHTFFPLCGASPRLIQLHSANNLNWKQASFLPLLKCQRAMTRFFKILLFFLIPVQTTPFGVASLGGQGNEAEEKDEMCCVEACVLCRLSSVVVCSLPVCVKQLTLAHMPPGGISSILMRVGAEEVLRHGFLSLPAWLWSLLQLPPLLLQFKLTFVSFSAHDST